MKKYGVILKNGSDWAVKASNRREAIRKVKAGKGRRVGQYLECEPSRRDDAFLLDE